MNEFLFFQTKIVFNFKLIIKVIKNLFSCFKEIIFIFYYENFEIKFIKNKTQKKKIDDQIKSILFFFIFSSYLIEFH